MSQKIGELSIILQNPSFTLNFSTLYSIFDLKIKTDPKWTQCFKKSDLSRTQNCKNGKEWTPGL